MNKEPICKRAVYLAPHIEVIEVENEGVMASSGDINDLGNGGSWSSSTYRGGRGAASRGAGNAHSTSTLSEIEDLINDILTY